MILSSFRAPDIAQLYELRFVCRSVGAAASHAFLTKIKNLLVLNRDRSPAFAIAVENIRAGPGLRLAPFSLGRLLRAAGLPSESSFVAPIVDRLYWFIPECDPQVGALLRGLGSSAFHAVDILWTLCRSLQHVETERIHNVLDEVFPDPESTPELVRAFMASAILGGVAKRVTRRSPLGLPDPNSTSQ